MKVQENKKYFVLFYMAGFVIGILYTNLIAGDSVAGTGIFDSYFLEQYAQTDIQISEFIWYIVYIRISPLVLLATLGCTRLRKGAALAYVLWTGFSSGMLLTVAVMNMGVKGIILCLLALTPQFFCYVAAYLMLLLTLYGYPAVRWNLSKTVCFLLLLLTGILLECYVNPVIMQMFIRTL